MDWQNWCRLCGNYDTLTQIAETVADVAKKLDIGSHETRVCKDCSSYLNEIHQFVQRSKALELMFLELETTTHDYEVEHFQTESVEYGQEKNINNIRDRFGLKVFVEEKNNEGLENLFEETGALEIKIENENDLEMASAMQESNALEEKVYLEGETVEEGDFIEGSELDDNLTTEYNDDDDDVYKSDDSSSSDNDDEYITEEMNQTARNIKKDKTKDDYAIFDFNCHVCKQEFQKMSILANHCHKIHECFPQVSCFCGKVISTSKRLKIHMQKHFPEKYNYECCECKISYKMKTSYINHMKLKHGPEAKKFVCSQCARCFKDSRSLLSHEKTHLPNEMKVLHSCDVCDKKFVNKNSLKCHVMSVHEMFFSFTCETCGKSFSTKSNLKSHLYSHSNEKNVQCDICSACFKNMDSLRKHKKTHMEKSFECKICHQRYRNRNNLKAHMVCHSDEKNFQCTFCPNTYKRSKDLKCHLNLHTGERPYVCQFCSRTFINGSNCRKHKLKDHPEELAAFESMHGKGKSAAHALNAMKQS